jgi:hypothetical protein
LKISFPNCRSGAGTSIRAVINALLKPDKQTRTATKKNAPQITSEWNYRPRLSPWDTTIDNTTVEALDSPTPDSFATNGNDNVWLDFIEPGSVEDAGMKAPLPDRTYATSTYD